MRTYWLYRSCVKCSALVAMNFCRRANVVDVNLRSQTVKCRSDHCHERR